MTQRHILISAEAVLYALRQIGFDHIPMDAEVLSISHDPVTKQFMLGYAGDGRQRSECGSLFYDESFARWMIREKVTEWR